MPPSLSKGQIGAEQESNRLQSFGFPGVVKLISISYLFPSKVETINI